MVDTTRMPLELFYEREAKHPNKLYMVQPLSGGQLINLSWADVGEQARRAANWLRAQELPAASRIAIVSKNCAHWIIADLAIWMAGHVSVPLYPNLTAESMRQVLEHSESKIAFIGKLDDWASMAPGVPDGVRTVSLPLHPQARFDHSWDELQRCAPIQDSPSRASDELSTIIYTSGTTGTPKGVMHHFANFGFSASNAVALFDVTENDRVLSYLPLCHVAERMFVQMASLYAGMTVYFAESLETFVQDIRRARPTVMFGVPRIWTKFQLGVFSKMPEQKLNRLLRIPFVSKVVARKVLDGLGLDKVRYALSGAAPVPESLLNWYRRLGMEIQEVYGMTENCGYSHVCRPGQFKQGWIGQNNPGVEVRIAEDGEVQVRSGGTMQGYYKDPEKTAETITADGFLRTGDKGEQDEFGNLRLTGRIKEIFKTSKGKYVAPNPIENRLGEHSFIEQVCVVGDCLPQPIALVVLSEVGQQQEQSQGHAEVQAVLEQLLDHVNAQLDQHERMSTLVVVKDVWAVENGFLTPTMKIKRAVIESAYGEQFANWQQSEAKVLWQR